MPTATSKEAKSVSGHTSRRLTVSEAARLLKVTRPHLSKVIHGHRESRSLKRRYQELLDQQLT